MPPADIAQQLSVIRDEIRSARMDAARELVILGGALFLASVGGAFLIGAVAILLESAVAALITAGFKLALASVVVAVPALIVGLLILWAGIRRLKRPNPA